MWKAIYVKSRHEKKVAESLKNQGIETYVPLRKKLKEWSDRKKWVEEPVISCYVFLNIEENQREEILRNKSVVAFVRNRGKDAKISKQEIDIMKSILSENEIEVNLENISLEVGQICEVIKGPMGGKIVKLYEKKGKRKVGVVLEELKIGLSIDINPAYLKVLG